MSIVHIKLRHSVQLFVALMTLCSVAAATENGASVWPVGAESYMSAFGPRAHTTQLYEYTVFLAANELDDAKGHAVPVDFRLRVFAVAGLVSHDWGTKFLGGELGSHVAAPFVYQQVHAGQATNSTQQFSNINLVPITAYYHSGWAHWIYELQVQTEAPGYQKGAAVNIGQHNMAFTPAAAFTLIPHNGAQNITSRFDYVINGPDHATHYHSGNEFFWQYDAQQRLPFRDASLGLTGFYYQQMTNDSLGGAPAVTVNADGSQSIGYRGRVLDFGPQMTLPWGKEGALVVKWDHDMLVQNKPRGNSFWFQFSIPFSYMRPHTAKL